jgi:5-oxoprolinase (ATP-hydrolysing)
MRTIMIHPPRACFRFGMGFAQTQARREQAVERPLDPATMPILQRAADALSKSAVEEVTAQGIARAAVTTHVSLHLRYQGTDSALAVPFGTLTEIETRFAEIHRARFGFWDQGRTLIVEAIAVDAAGQAALPSLPAIEAKRTGPLAPRTTTTLFADGQSHTAPIYLREALNPGDRITGPALIIEPHSTIVIDPSWQAEYRADGNVIATKTAARTTARSSTAADPVRLKSSTPSSCRSPNRWA